MPKTSVPAHGPHGLPARTHHEANALLSRPFAPGAIGFRAMIKTSYGGRPYAGAQVAAFLHAQSVVQRLNAVAPGRWQQQFTAVTNELTPAPSNDRSSRRVYLACRLTITLPLEPGGEPVDAVYEDIGEMEAGSLAGLKALYSDARKRAAVAAGIGAYLYTALEPVTLPLGAGPRQVQVIRRAGKPDLLALSPETEQWLRHGYLLRMTTPAVVRDLGPILAHGEPETGMGQGETGEAAAPASNQPAETAADSPADEPNGRTGAVAIDIARLHPAPRDDAA